MKQKVRFSAIVLDDESHAKVLAAVAIPEGWKTFAHHMTLCLSALPADQKGRIGETVTLVCTKAGRTDKALALKVDNQTRLMDGTPHITVAVNEANGGKPKHSNDIALFYEPIVELTLTGTIQEVS